MKAVLRTPMWLAVSAATVIAAPSQGATLLPGDFIVTDQVRSSVIRIDGSNGSRTAISGCADAGCSSTIGTGAPLAAPTGLARALTDDPLAPLYVTDTLSLSLLAIDPSTGNRSIVSSSVTGLGPDFLSPVAVSITAGGDLFVIDDELRALLHVDPITGDRSVVSGCVDAACSSIQGQALNGADFSAPFDLVIDEDTAFVLDTDLQTIFSVDLLSGDRDVVSSAAVGAGDSFVNPRSVALDGGGGLLVTDSGASQLSPGKVLEIDPDTGDRSALVSGTLDTGRTLEVPVDVLLDGNELVVLDNSPGVLLGIVPPDLDRILSEPADGGITLASPVHIVQVPVPIPEPGTAALVALGCALLAWKRRERS